ncbi:MAG: hypothetical protein U9O82_00745 [Thermodesulfobacteriota bacterium]|nr:hypothetical protein [Thermodesulfobacteriota bacterium]
MPELLKLYLDQMLRLDVAQALRVEGHDVFVRLKSAKPEQMTMKYCRKQLLEIEFLLLLMNILVIG